MANIYIYKIFNMLPNGKLLIKPTLKFNLISVRRFIKENKIVKIVNNIEKKKKILCMAAENADWSTNNGYQNVGFSKVKYVNHPIIIGLLLWVFSLVDKF